MGISAMWNAVSLVQDLNSITITPRAPPKFNLFNNYEHSPNVSVWEYEISLSSSNYADSRESLSVSVSVCLCLCLSLSLSHSPSSITAGRSFRWYLLCAQSWRMKVFDGQPTLMFSWVVVHRRTLLLSSSFFFFFLLCSSVQHVLFVLLYWFVR